MLRKNVVLWSSSVLLLVAIWFLAKPISQSEVSAAETTIPSTTATVESSQTESSHSDFRSLNIRELSAEELREKIGDDLDQLQSTLRGQNKLVLLSGGGLLSGEASVGDGEDKVELNTNTDPNGVTKEELLEILSEKYNEEY